MLNNNAPTRALDFVSQGRQVGFRGGLGSMSFVVLLKMRALWRGDAALHHLKYALQDYAAAAALAQHEFIASTRNSLMSSYLKRHQCGGYVPMVPDSLSKVELSPQPRETRSPKGKSGHP